MVGNAGITFAGAFALALGIAIQNFPEGMAIALPYKADGTSNKKAFLMGTLSRSSRAYCCSGYYFN